MTIKSLMIGTASAALIAGAATAQSESAEDDTTETMTVETVDGETVDVEVTVEGAEGAETETAQEGDAGTVTEDGAETEMAQEGDAGTVTEDPAEVDMAQEDDSATATEDGAETEMAQDSETAPEGELIPQSEVESEMAQDTTSGDMTDDTVDDGMGTTGTYDADADTQAMDPVQFRSLEAMTVGDVLGLTVYSAADERVGDIDYIINSQPDPAAVIGIGGFLGLGEYTVAVPLQDFELGPDGNRLILGTDRETLRSQPEFDESGLEGLDRDVPLSQIMSEG